MAAKKTDGTQEACKTGQAYKVTCGTYKSREEALQRAVEVKKAGGSVTLAIANGGYTLTAAENLSQTEAENAKNALAKKKVEAQVIGQ